MSALKLLLWKAYLAKLAHMSTVKKMTSFLEREGAEREVKLTATNVSEQEMRVNAH